MTSDDRLQLFIFNDLPSSTCSTMWVKMAAPAPATASAFQLTGSAEEPKRDVYLFFGGVANCTTHFCFYFTGPNPVTRPHLSAW